jgi:uncharacterized RDD family membrane protein YckC
MHRSKAHDRDTRALASGRALLLVPNVDAAFGVTVNKLFLLAFSLDCLWPLWHKENRAIHDMLAGTRVRFADAPQVTGERAPMRQSLRSG